MLKTRYLTEFIHSDLQEKMVFVGGARQVGKTTLARQILSQRFSRSEYYNWDFAPDRKRLKNLEFPGEESLLIFDELHKLRGWKNYLKGLYDHYHTKYRFIVTGSARLNIYRRGGDSLQGRYHYFTLHPFSLAELKLKKFEQLTFNELVFNTESSSDEYLELFQFGGFPEPLMKQSTRTLRRWHAEKLERLFREEIMEVEDIRNLSSLKLLCSLLPDKAGGPLSINALREDLEVSHKAVTSWLNILEQFYYHFRIYPFHSSKVRSLRKEPKIYLLDWSEVEKEGARFENLIASHLLKFVDFLKENDGYNAELYYLRNVDNKEVDFLVTVDRKPWFAVETKLSDTTPAPNLFYFRDRLKIPYVYQVIHKQGIDILRDDVRIISAEKFLTGLI